jgi:hypothetical protein
MRFKATTIFCVALWVLFPLSLAVIFPMSSGVQPVAKASAANLPLTLDVAKERRPFHRLKVEKPKPHHKPKVKHHPKPKRKQRTHRVSYCERPSTSEWWIIVRESRGDPTADNPRSSAFGLGQLLYNNRARFARVLGVLPETISYCAQLSMFRLYYHERYGSIYSAVAFWRGHGWY